MTIKKLAKLYLKAVLCKRKAVFRLELLNHVLGEALELPHLGAGKK